MNKAIEKNDESDLSWLAEENPLVDGDLPYAKGDGVGQTIAEIVSDVAINTNNARDVKIDERKDVLSKTEIEKSDVFVKQLTNAVKVFYKSPKMPPEEEAFWYEEITENLGVIKKEQITHIKSHFQDIIDANAASREKVNVQIKESDVKEWQKKVINNLYTREKMQEYGIAVQSGEGAIQKFWEQQRDIVRRDADTVNDGHIERVMRTLRGLLDETYVKYVLKNARVQISKKYTHVDRENSDAVNIFWERVMQKTREHCPQVSQNILMQGIQNLRNELDQHLNMPAQKEAQEFSTKNEKGSEDRSRDMEQKLRSLENELREARALCFEKKQQQENAWAKIKAFFNVDPQEHADIHFVQNEYEKAYQRYRAARIEQLIEMNVSNSDDIKEFERILDITEAKKRFDAETNIRAKQGGLGAMRILERVVQWQRLVPQAVKRGMVATFVVVGLLMGSGGNVVDHNNAKVVNAKQETVQHDDVQEDAVRTHINIDPVVRESGEKSEIFLGSLQQEKQQEEKTEHKEIYDNKGIEVLERSVLLTIDEDGEGVEHAIAQYLYKEHKQMLKAEKKTAAQVAHIIVQKYATKNPAVDIQMTWKDLSHIIVDYTPQNRDAQSTTNVSSIADFSIVEINPKRILPRSTKKAASESKRVISEQKSDASGSLAQDTKEDAVSQFDAQTVKREVVDVAYVLKDHQAQKIITEKMKELFGARQGAESPRDFRVMHIAHVLSDTYMDTARQERVKKMIALARTIVGNQKMPIEDCSVGLYMIRLYSVIAQKNKTNQDGGDLVYEVFGSHI